MVSIAQSADCAYCIVQSEPAKVLASQIVVDQPCHDVLGTEKLSEQSSPHAELNCINGIQNWIVTYIDEGALERLELAFSKTGDCLPLLSCL